jgi:aspartokinase/homoserine dehydrogenase 1
VAIYDAIDKDMSESVATPRGTTNAWEVHKFGGASLASADLYRTVGDLLITESKGRGSGSIPTMAVVSARGGMTDLLVKVVDSALVDFEEAKANLENAVESQIALLRELAPAEITDPIEERFRADAKDILSVVQSLRMIRTVPAVTMEVVSGYGEIWSAQTLHAYLQTQSVPCDWIDAREILVVKSEGGNAGLGEKGEASTGGVTPLWAETARRMASWWNTVGKEDGFLELDYEKESPIVIVTGFVATTADGVPTTLKRSGSDYSATVFAKLTGAGRVTMWKNTDGVYTADPRRVPDAFSISSLKYDEAMELAYFGAQVLHPSAMVPCIDDSIPVYVRNIFNPDFEGTVIQGRCPTLQDDINNKGGKVKNWRSNKGVSPIKGITSVDKVSLVSLEGASAIGGANVAEKFMGAMADNGINVLIITQASSESSITVAVPANQGEKALASLQDAFELELTRSTIGKLFLTTDMSIVAIVGEGMAMSSGVSATFMSSLARANVNIRVIAQGSSERQIAVVVDSSDTTRALRAAHMAFTLSETAVSVAVLGGTGDVGSSFVRQLQRQKAMLAKNLDVEMRVNIAANSQKMLFGKDFRGLDLDCLSEKLSKNSDAADLDLDLLTAELEKDVNPHRVIVDCTNSMAVGEYYEKWLSSGISIISPNRKVAAGPLDYYRRVRRAQRENSVSWQYEAGVGSALPLLTTLKDLIDTGDKINYIKGSVSGTLAYVLSTMSEDIPFSEAVRQAVEKGYAEIDFREDLAGEDMSRKVVILARQIGMDVEMSDVQVESLIPDEIIKKEYPEDRKAMQQELLDDLKVMDESMLERFRAAEQNDSVLRYKFVIDAETGKCKCSLEPVPRTDPLYRLKANENLVAFETDLYTTSPLIVKGAAAGPELAAAGIFSDLLRVTRTFSSLQI